MSGASTPAANAATSLETSADRASLLTPVGRGAVAVIAAEGPAALAAIDSHFHATNGLQLSSQKLNRILFGHWTDSGARAGGERSEEVIVCRTGEAEVEIHCHGGIAAAERILSTLSGGGCRIEPWAQWLRLHGTSALETEAEIALAGALTRRCATILLDQRQGALRREVEAIRAELHSSGATHIAAPVATALRRLASLLATAQLGRRLTQPWQVAIAGRPNVGKSSLINALVGYQRAIVFDQPGTTRDVLAAETAVQGWPVRISDAAGLRASNDPLEAAGVDMALQQLRRADLVVWVLDAATLAPDDLAAPWEAARREMATELREQPAAALVVVNKSDLVPLLSPPLSSTTPMCVCTSALHGEGLAELLAAIAYCLVPEPPQRDAAVAFTARQFELLRMASDCLSAGDAPSADRALAELLI